MEFILDVRLYWLEVLKTQIFKIFCIYNSNPSGDVVQFSDHDSQYRFQNDLKIDNLLVKTSGDFDSDGVQEVYWKTADGSAYLRSLMHADGNIRYANYQSEEQMSNYLTSNGHSSEISNIVS